MEYIVNLGRAKYVLEGKNAEEAKIKAVNLYKWDTKSKFSEKDLLKVARARKNI